MRIFTFFPAIVLAALLSFSSTANAQARLGLFGEAALPLNEFDTMGYRAGGGFGFNLFSGPLIKGKRILENPLLSIHVGTNLDYDYMGMRKFTAVLDSPQSGDAEVRVYNRTLGWNGALRLIYNGYTVKPYLEGFIGARWFTTIQKIEPNDKKANSEYETVTTDKIINRAAFHYGASFGLLFPLAEDVDLDVGVTYSRGASARYQLLDRVNQEGNEIRYNFDRSRTDMLFIRLGFFFTLRESTCEDCPRQEPTTRTKKTRNVNNSNSKPERKKNTIKPNEEEKPGY